MGSVFHGKHRGLTGMHRAGGSTRGLAGDSAANLDDGRDDAGFKALAVAVLRQAFMDIGVELEGRQGRRPRERCVHRGPGTVAEDARAWLTASCWSRARSLWLAWLGLTDAEFQTMLSKATHQGQVNQVSGFLTA